MNLKGFAGLFLGLSIGVSALKNEEGQRLDFQRDFKSWYDKYIEPYKGLLDEIDSPVPGDPGDKPSVMGDMLGYKEDIEGNHDTGSSISHTMEGVDGLLSDIKPVDDDLNARFRNAIRQKLSVSRGEDPIEVLRREAKAELSNIRQRHSAFLEQTQRYGSGASATSSRHGRR